MSTAEIEPWVADAVRTGWYGTIETRGHRSGDRRRVPVGFVELDDGSLLVGAGDAAAGWVRNLDADARCRFERRGETGHFVAEALEGEARNDAIRRLHLRYGDGTPITGRHFRLHPVTPARNDGEEVDPS